MADSGVHVVILVTVFRCGTYLLQPLPYIKILRNKVAFKWKQPLWNLYRKSNICEQRRISARRPWVGFLRQIIVLVSNDKQFLQIEVSSPAVSIRLFVLKWGHPCVEGFKSYDLEGLTNEWNYGFQRDGQWWPRSQVMKNRAMERQRNKTICWSSHRKTRLLRLFKKKRMCVTTLLF